MHSGMTTPDNYCRIAMSAEELKEYHEQLAAIDAQLLACKDPDEKIDLETTRADLIELVNLMESEEGEEGLVITKPDEDSMGAEEGATSVEDDLGDLVGMRCRAPVVGSYAPFGLDKHAAIVLDIEGIDAEKGVMLLVLYSHPLVASMRPCPHFLADTCMFGEKCKYSHGAAVPASELEDYEEPDFDSITEGSPVLVAVEPLWEVGRVTAKDGDELAVKILRTGAEVHSKISTVVPIDGEIVKEDEKEVPSQFEELKGDALGRVTKADLGNWEGGGIGLKLMLKMGYKKGEGLGANSDGIVHAIQARICPKGASLDALMERKKRGKALRVVDGVAAKRLKEAKPRNDAEAGIFALLNRKLAPAPTKFTQAEEEEKERKSLMSSTSADLGAANLNTELKLRELKEKEQKLLDGLRRNAKDKETVHRLNTQLAAVQKQMTALEGKKGRIAKEIDHRSSRKKDVF